MATTVNQTTTPALEPIPLPTRPPAGYWVRDAAHARLPRTTLNDVLAEALIRVNRRVYAEFGIPFETIEYQKIGGWDYIRLAPLGGKEPPRLPAWLAGLALLVVPAVRRRTAAAVTAIRSDLAATLLGQWESEWRPELSRRATALRGIDLASLDDTVLDEHLGLALALLDDGLEIHFRLHPPIALALAELAFTCRELLGWDEAQAFRLLVGTSGMSTAPARALAELAAEVTARPGIRGLVENDAPVDEVLAADRHFATRFAGYLEEYGYRALSCEVADPCLDEQPQVVLALLRDQLATGYDPDAADEANRARRAATRAEAERLLAERPARDRDRFGRALRRALRAYPVREDNEFFTFSAPQGLLHKAVAEVGRRLADRGLLDTAGDVFDLEPERLRTALREGVDCRATARTRAAERAWALAHPAPPSYGPPPGPPPSLRWLPAEARMVTEAVMWTFEQVFGAEAMTADRQPDPDRATLTGIAASAGSYTGPARIIRGEDEFNRLRAGDVLVCPATSPVWSVLFAGVGALVANDGGMLSHQAIIAREYGIPAVVGTNEATDRLVDGQLVTVDGTTGTVRVIS